MTLAILVLGGFSCFWMHVHWQEYLRARKQLSAYYNEIAENGQDKPWRHDYTGTAAVLA